MKLAKIGIQLYTIRDYMNNAENIGESFKRLKALGYDYGQTAGCAVPFAEFGKLAAEADFEICGTHEDFGTMLNNPELAMKQHDELGTKIMGIGGFGAGSVAEVEQFIENANKVAANIGPAGYKFTYHNHSHEFRRLENGRTAMDMLVEGLDPKYTSFCLDTYWVQHGGGDVRHWINKLAGRIDILHLKEMGRNDNGPFITEIGNGNIWWEGVLETAVESGVKYFVVEQDIWPGDPFDSAKKSSEYLHKYFM